MRVHVCRKRAGEDVGPWWVGVGGGHWWVFRTDIWVAFIQKKTTKSSGVSKEKLKEVNIIILMSKWLIIIIDIRHLERIQFVTLRNSQQDTFCEKSVRKNFTKFTEKNNLIKSK